jgi:predicted nucleic acid-binding protein
MAKEYGADLVLMDERKGRSIAKEFGIKTTGILGILLEAKNKNQIMNVKPYLDQLITHASFYLTRDVYNEVLKISDKI